MATITVKAKIDAGFHPGLQKHIAKGESYEIGEQQFSDELFERPSPDWLAPWEQSEPEPAAKEAPAGSPADEKTTGGKKK